MTNSNDRLISRFHQQTSNKKSPINLIRFSKLITTIGSNRVQSICKKKNHQFLSDLPKDHWTLKTGHFEDPTPAIQVQTLPLEGPRSLGLFGFSNLIQDDSKLTKISNFEPEKRTGLEHLSIAIHLSKAILRGSTRGLHLFGNLGLKTHGFLAKLKKKRQKIKG